MKLVKESLNEIMHFERSSNPLVTLQVGKKELIKKWLDEMDVEKYVINRDFTIDVFGSVYLYEKELEKFPDYIQFADIHGSFECGENKLTTLKGCPTYVEK